MGDITTEGAKVFTGAGDPKLPSHIQELSEEKRTQWVGAWNGRFKQCQADGGSAKDCEGSAFAVANAAIKAALPADEGDAFAAKCGTSDYWFAKIDQEEAAYNPIGSTDTTACANCRWFISPNNCGIVDSWPDPITSNGLSNRWEATPSRDRDPLRVVIVGEEGEAALSDPEDGQKAETKREGGVDYPSFDYAVVPDTDKPITWKLRLAEGSAGNVTVAQVGRAITALQPGGFRGNRVSLRSQQKTQAVSRIESAIGKTGGTDDQKANLRERLDAAKSRTIEVTVPQRMMAAVKAGILGLLGYGPDQQRPFVLFKDTDGNQRWFAWASNRWRDRDKPPEIISEKAHRDYVDYVDTTGRYPEAWLWHTPKTRWGKADWIDYADGFLMVSGTVDPGREHVADALAAQKDLGVSHGFVYRHSDPEQGIIGYYRSFEVSPLPVDAAANPWTSLEVLAKEADMGFTNAKRAWLVGALGEDEVARLEGDTKALKAALEAAGVEWKDGPEDDDKDKVPVPAEVPAVPMDTKALAEAAVKAVVESDAFKGIATGQATLTADVKGLVDRIVKLERTDDEKVAALVGGRERRPNGHVASQDGKSAITKEDADALSTGPSVDQEFFETTIMGGMEVPPQG